MKGMFTNSDVFKFGFTGSSELITDLQKQSLKSLISKYVNHRPAECHNGCCIEADEECQRIVLSIVPHTRLIYHPPTNMSKTFKYKLRLHDEKRKPLPYLKRNLAIVAESDCLFATPKTASEELRSGTWQTIRAARNLSLPICIIWPNGSLRCENWAKGM